MWKGASAILATPIDSCPSHQARHQGGRREFGDGINAPRAARAVATTNASVPARLVSSPTIVNGSRTSEPGFRMSATSVTAVGPPPGATSTLSIAARLRLTRRSSFEIRIVSAAVLAMPVADPSIRSMPSMKAKLRTVAIKGNNAIGSRAGKRSPRPRECLVDRTIAARDHLRIQPICEIGPRK